LGGFFWSVIVLSSQILRRIPGFSLEKDGGETMLYNAGSDARITISATTKLIWQLLDGRRTVGDCTDLISEAFPGQGTEIGSDVQEALTQLLGCGAIEES
jgi:hypothetical protein